VNGLHACKPGNEPQVGQVKTFVVEQRTGKSGKPYTKIKSASADMGGQPYRITAAKPTGRTDSYGNISFNLDIEPADGTSMPPPQSSPYQQSAPKDPRGNGEDRSSRIERQHSQEMAIRYCVLKKLDAIDDESLRKLIDWFQKDVGHVPNNKTPPPTPPPQSGSSEGPDIDDDIPF
jgi:hypothetical protein